ncbi:MAG: hypothetical protein HFI76_12215 [Lachnospiraceae bacterium]|nr:hypothetical protein [Lachnospiraceae bacterium]
MKQVMKVTEENGKGISIYGKMGMGMTDGIVVDAWYTGFAESEGSKLYFCVYLGKTDGKDVSSAAAKEIALRLAGDYL